MTGQIRLDCVWRSEGKVIKTSTGGVGLTQLELIKLLWLFLFNTCRVVYFCKFFDIQVATVRLTREISREILSNLSVGRNLARVPVGAILRNPTFESRRQDKWPPLLRLLFGGR